VVAPSLKKLRIKLVLIKIFPLAGAWWEMTDHQLQAKVFSQRPQGDLDLPQPQPIAVAYSVSVIQYFCGLREIELCLSSKNGSGNFQSMHFLPNKRTISCGNPGVSRKPAF
jgi:hypothetical protein